MAGGGPLIIVRDLPSEGAVNLAVGGRGSVDWLDVVIRRQDQHALDEIGMLATMIAEVVGVGGRCNRNLVRLPSGGRGHAAS